MLTNLRALKIFDMAVFDLTATIVSAIVIGRYTQMYILPWLVTLILLGIVVHIKLGIPTRLNQYLGLTTEKELQEYRAR